MGRQIIPPDDPLTLEIVKLYESGLGAAAIGKKVFLSYSAVHSRLRSAGVKLRTENKRKPIPQYKVKRIKALFAAGRSYRKIAEEVGVSHASVRKYCKQ